MIIYIVILYTCLINFLTAYFSTKKFQPKSSKLSHIFNLQFFLLNIILLINTLINLLFFNKNRHIPYFYFSHPLFYIFKIIGIYIYLLFYSTGSKSQKIYWSSLLNSTTTFISMILCYFGSLYDISTKNLSVQLILLYLGFVIIHYITLSLFFKNSPKLEFIDSYTLIFNTVINFISLMFIINIFNSGAFYLAMLLAIFFIGTYLVYSSTLKKLSLNKMKTIDLEYNQKNLELKSQYYDEILLINQEVKKYKHDMANHLNLLYYYLDSNQTEEGKQYIEKMADVSHNIKSDLFLIESSNNTLDFILNSKLLIAHKENILTKTTIDLKEELTIPPFDLCTLLGNLLDNSLEACKRYKEGIPIIDITINSSNNIFHLTIQNSSNPVNYNEYGELISTKNSDNHGFGLKQIKSMIENYKGTYETGYKNSIFKTKITLPLN